MSSQQPERAVKSQIESPEDGLSEIRKLLQQAVEKKIDDHEKTTVEVSEAIDLTNEIEDAIYAHKHRKTNRLTEFMEGFRQRGDRNRKLLSRIDLIKTNLQKEVKDTEAAKSGSHRPDTEEAEWHHRVMSTDVEEDEVVGFSKPADEIINQLNRRSPSLDVVSIVGMGGLGKTTLARLIYRRVKSDFDRSAWVFVSNDDPRDRYIWLSLLRRWIPVPEFKEAESKQVNELKNMVKEHLEDKRYLIILDDIWNINVWDKVVDAFPNNHKGSRILITSRIKSVASHASQTTPPYCLEFLSNEDSWKLFRDRLLINSQSPSVLEHLGRKIVKSCQRLPLAIVVLAGLLQTKEKSAREWSRIEENINWYLTRDESPVNNIFKLSYHNLPPRLKICFLYLGLFPQDYEIPFRQLLHLWIAEGFCHPISESERSETETETTNLEEDVAEQEYFKELVDRSLIQVERRTDGSVKTCQIHDLLRHFCIYEAKKCKVFEIYPGNEMFKAKEDISRRISVHCNAPLNMFSSTRDHSSICSFLCFGQKYNFDQSHWKWLLKNFPLLRVLDLGRVQRMSPIPKKIDKLIILRYLRTGPTESPLNIDAICNLGNLETLDLRSSSISALPKGIHKLQRLRHLYIGGDLTIPDRSESDEEVMKHLQTLSTVALNQKNVSQLEMGTFPDLKKLGFISSHDELNLGLLQRLECLGHLKTLKIINVSGFATSASGFPPNLAKISLVNITDFDERDMKTLGSLPHLKILKLSGMENSSDLKCAAGDFPELQVFQMKSLSCGNWELAQDAMPKLQRFVLDSCENMTGLPNELWSLSDLQAVVVMQPSSEMDDNLQKLMMKGENRITIYHPLAGEAKQASSD